MDVVKTTRYTIYLPIMRIITGTIRSTPTQWLPVLSHIVPPHIRRQSAALKSWNKFNFNPDSFPVLSYIPENRIPRLKSRKPLWSNSFLNSNFSNVEIWKSEWQAGSWFQSSQENMVHFKSYQDGPWSL